jgi:hypothetical protein
MGNPVRSDVHVDQPLTNISLAAFNQPESFIAMQAFPRVPVMKESDKYFIFTKSHTFRVGTKLRAPGDPVALRDFALTTATYSAEEYATGMALPDRIIDNADSPLRPMEDAATILTHDMLMYIEQNWGAENMVASIWAGAADVTLTSTDQWSDFSGSDPITNIDTAKFAINGATGIPTNQLSVAMGSAVWNKLKRHPSMLGAFGGGFSGMKVLTRAQAAEILDVKEILVSEAVYNSYNEGGSTQTLSRIVGKNCLVFYRPATPSLMTAAAGYFFTKTLSEIYRYYLPRRKSEVVEISSIFDFKCTDTSAGAMILAAVA